MSGTAWLILIIVVIVAVIVVAVIAQGARKRAEQKRADEARVMREQADERSTVVDQQAAKANEMDARAREAQAEADAKAAEAERLQSTAARQQERVDESRTEVEEHRARADELDPHTTTEPADEAADRSPQQDADGTRPRHRPGDDGDAQASAADSSDRLTRRPARHDDAASCWRVLPSCTAAAGKNMTERTPAPTSAAAFSGSM